MLRREYAARLFVGDGQLAHLVAHGEHHGLRVRSEQAEGDQLVADQVTKLAITDEQPGGVLSSQNLPVVIGAVT